MNHAVSFLSRRWPGLLPALCLAGALGLFNDYGIGWDDTVQARYGEMVLDYFLSGGADKSCENYYNLKYFGPAIELFSAAVHRLLGLEPFALRRLICAFFAVLTLPALAGLGRLLGGNRSAFFSLLALLLLPRFFGHAFVNTKDIPFACFTAWAVYSITRVFDGGGWRWAAGCGLAMGLALGIRAGGFLLFLFLGAAGAIWLLQHKAWERKPEINKQLLHLMFQSAAAVLAAWAVMAAVWPYAHSGPLLKPAETFLMFNRYQHTVSVLFAGQAYDSGHLPWFYLPWLLTVTTPLNLLFLGLLGLGAGLGRHWKARGTPAARAFFLLLFWFFFPVFYIVIFRPNIYDGIRHVLFLLPALALFAGLGADFVFKKFKPRLGAAGAAILAGAALLMESCALARLHPFQMTYFNPLAGPRQTLHRHYETDYWLLSYKEAAEWLNRRQAEARRPLRVLIAANDYSRNCALYFLDEPIQPETTYEHRKEKRLPPRYDYYLSTVRYAFDRNFPHTPTVRTISRGGATFAVIKGRQPGMPPEKRTGKQRPSAQTP